MPKRNATGTAADPAPSTTSLEELRRQAAELGVEIVEPEPEPIERELTGDGTGTPLPAIESIEPVEPAGSPLLRCLGRVTDVDRAKRTVRVRVSDDVQDRHGTTVDQNGWLLDSYQRNPRVLWNHDGWGLPVGRGEQTEVVDGALHSTIRFPLDLEGARGSYYDMISTIGAFFLADPAYLDAVSAGWETFRYLMPGEENPRERGRGEPYPPDLPGMRYLVNELWEYSVVSLPSLPVATAERQAMAAELRGIIGRADEHELDEIEKRIVHAARSPVPAKETETGRSSALLRFMGG